MRFALNIGRIQAACMEYMLDIRGFNSAPQAAEKQQECFFLGKTALIYYYP